MVWLSHGMIHILQSVFTLIHLSHTVIVNPCVFSVLNRGPGWPLAPVSFVLLNMVNIHLHNTL